MTVLKADGVRLGRPVSAETRVAIERILTLAADGMSQRAVAEALTAEGMPRASGNVRPWNAAAVNRALRSHQLDMDAAARRAVKRP